MGGKKGIPSAKEKAADKARDEAAKAAKAKEDDGWLAAGEGKKSKSQARKVAKDEERADAQAKKQEARRMAEEEAEALASSKKKAVGPKKVTKYELDQQNDKEKQLNKQAAAAQEMQARREVDEGTYAQLVDVKTDNSLEDVDARNVDQALSQLGMDEKPKMKYSQYFERELPTLKSQKPGLKAPQYKDMLWKKWLRSPENPHNQK